MIPTPQELFETDDLRWEALATRDRRAEGAFLYAVSTTGVYCRPTCSSRLPNRRNVCFFADRAEAERAGYRACKRCRPDAVLDRERSSDAITRACALLEDAEEQPTLKELAAGVGLSPFHFHRTFKAMVGVTPREYAAARRRQRLQGGLREGGPVTRAIYDAGFGSCSRVYESAENMLGMTPSTYQRGAAGLPIRFAVAQTSLGWALVAATERGICMIDLGDSPEVLTARVRARFPDAALQQSDSEFATRVAQVTALIDVPGRGLDLPLDIQGTAFQQRVWKALQEIPAGTTASYAEVGARIGRPTAARAVARACASNPLAVAIPCHRVIGSDGDLAGYRWGIERKRALLAREAGAGELRFGAGGDSGGGRAPGAADGLDPERPASG